MIAVTAQKPAERHTPSAAAAPSSERSPLAAHLRALHQVSARSRFAKGETIFDESDATTHAYLVLSGVARLCKYTVDGRRQIIDFIQAGEFFGLMKRREYGFTAEAVSDVSLLAYPLSQIARLEATVPGVQRLVDELLSEQMLAMQRHLVTLGCQTAKERLASFLLVLSERCHPVAANRLDMSMGRQDIADHLGLTIETVCRALGELKRERLIAVPNVHQIVLTDIDALVDLAEGGGDDDMADHAARLPGSSGRARAKASGLVS